MKLLLDQQEADVSSAVLLEWLLLIRKALLLCLSMLWAIPQMIMEEGEQSYECGSKFIV
jgi:hypothetical protein